MNGTRSLPEYSVTKHCTIFVGTWNVNGRVCYTQ